MSAVFLTVSKMLSMESPTGRTKHALNIARLRPAFINVGLFGKNFVLTIKS